jgi:branched-chain amino acid transport system permease protein
MHVNVEACDRARASDSMRHRGTTGWVTFSQGGDGVTQFLQLVFDGFALGCVYALIALGFTVVYRATQVINFAQGAMLLVGAYLVSLFAAYVSLPFWASVVFAVALLAVGGVVFQVCVLRRMVGQPLFTIVMITIGLSIAVTAGVDAVFGPNQRVLGDPWGASRFTVGGVVFTWVKVWGAVVAGGLLACFFVFDRYSRYGAAMRATAADPEAALAVGIPVRTVHALAWGIAGGIAAIGGLFLAGFPNSPNPQLGDVAFLAFPAVIVGGLDSPLGAVVGGVVIGVVQVLTSGYEPGWTGNNFYEAAPYIVMIAVLLAKPYGLFGSRPADRL